jgi:ketosteroid isomerase-like protein
VGPFRFAKRRRRRQIERVLRLKLSLPDAVRLAMNDDDLALLRSVLVGPPDEEMVALEAQIRAAQLGADVAVLDRLIAEELLFAGPDGRLGTKAQDLEAHGSGTIRFRSHEPEELRVRRIGADVAITSLRARLAVELGGRMVRGTYRYTRVWAREDGHTWRVAGGQVSEVQTL